MDWHYLYPCSFIFLKMSCEPDDDLEQVDTCRSLKYIEFGCV